MRDLPSGWAKTTLGDVNKDCLQTVPSDEQSFRYIDIASVDREKKLIFGPQQLIGRDAPSRARKLLAKGDVLVSMTRPNLNAVALVPKELDGEIASTGFDVLRASEIDPRWIFYTVRSTSFVERMGELVQGALYPAIRGKDIRGYEIPLAPLPEQKRIADKLDSVLARVDACRDRLDRLPALLKRFRQSILAAATSGQLTNEWRANFVSSLHEKFEISGNTNLPPSWGELPVKELCRVVSGCAFKSTEFVSSGVLAIKISNVQYGYFEEKNQEYLPTSYLTEYQKFVIKPGDLLLALTRPITNGQLKTCIYPNDQKPGLLNQRVCKIQCSGAIDEHYFALYMQSSCFLEQVSAGLSETLQPNLSPKDLELFVIKTPPLPEQTEIVRRVEILFAFADRLEARLATARRQVGQLTPALLAKAFRGELIPQDPADEPAAELLKRLAAQREAAPKAKRGRASKA